MYAGFNLSKEISKSDKSFKIWPHVVLHQSASEDLQRGIRHDTAGSSWSSFFSTYTLLVLFWAEIYHQARSLPTEKLRPAYFIINGIIYFFQICIWIYMRFSKTVVAVEVAELFFSFISLGAAVGFMVYGGRLFAMLRRFPIESRGRQNKLHEVGFVTGICCTCFLIRCVMVAIAAFNKNADMHVLNHPILDFFYYMIVEILPSALVLFILRKLPPRRVSDQYHPIK